MSEIISKELVVPLGEGITARGASVTVAKDVKYEAVERALQSVATLEKIFHVDCYSLINRFSL